MDTTATEKRNDFENGLEGEAGEKLHHVEISKGALRAAARYVEKPKKGRSGRIIEGVCIYCDDEERGGVFATDGYQAISVPADPDDPPYLDGAQRLGTDIPCVVVSPKELKPVTQGTDAGTVAVDFDGQPGELFRIASGSAFGEKVSISAANMEGAAAYPNMAKLFKPSEETQRVDAASFDPAYLATLSQAAKDLTRHRYPYPMLVWDRLSSQKHATHIAVKAERDLDSATLADVLVMEIVHPVVVRPAR